MAGDWFGFPAGTNTAPKHWNTVCSSLRVLPPVKCFNLFDGAFIQHYFCCGGFLCGDDVKEKHLKARAGYTQGVCGCRRVMYCGSLEGTKHSPEYIELTWIDFFFFSGLCQPPSLLKSF